VTPLEIKIATFQLVAQCLNQLHHHVQNEENITYLVKQVCLKFKGRSLRYEDIKLLKPSY